LDYITVFGNPTRAANMLPGGPAEVIAAVKAGVDFVWLTPNDDHNMHDQSVSFGDAWLASWIPQLIQAMAGKRGLIILWWDEGYTSPPYMPLFFAGPAAKTLTSSVEYNHYSLLKLIEVQWGGGSLNQGDTTAGDPSEFLL